MEACASGGVGDLNSCRSKACDIGDKVLKTNS